MDSDPNVCFFPLRHPMSAPDTRSPAFAETEWSLVLRSTTEGDEGQKSLARLCQQYWWPLYTHLRRQGYVRADAEDLTQSFFAQLLARATLTHADPTRGRFRSFLLTSLQHFVLNHRERQHAAKRGGLTEHLPLDESNAALAESLGQRSDLTPDQVFDRAWALSLLQTALLRLQTSFAAEGKMQWFIRLRPFLEAKPGPSDYETVAQELGISKNAVAVSVHRLQQKYRETVRSLVVETVAHRGDAESELKHLIASLSG
jgi:RNA polymerase sigma factor (sigma-70 family)